MVSFYFFITPRDILQVYSTTQLWLMTYLDTWWLPWIPFKDLLLLLQLRHDFVGYVLRLSVSLFSSRLFMPLCKTVFLEVLVLYIHSYVPFFFSASVILFHHLKSGLGELFKVTDMSALLWYLCPSSNTLLLSNSISFHTWHQPCPLYIW